MAEKFRWIEKLANHPLFQCLVSESKGQLPNNESRNLLAERNGEIFVWFPSKSRVLTTNLKNVLFDNPRAEKYQALLCTSQPLFEVHMLRFSLTGKYLALVGYKGITIIEMPQRWGRFAEYQGGASTISCRTIPIDERFFAVHANAIMVLEVKWHPASSLDSHLVVLVSDNTLRIYNILKPETPDQVINLGDPFSNEVSHSRGRMTSTSAFAIALGETSVAFDFAPPISKTKLSNHRTRQEECEVIHPMFILRENADVYYLVFELGKKGFGHEMIGPLTMHPATENNYGLDACSLLCLPVQPPVVVIATATGRIYHCIALETPGEDSESDPGSENESDKPSTPDLTLYVHECVELQRSLSSCDGDEVSSTVSQSDESLDSLNSCPVKLYPDTSSSNQYHCSHPSGAHTIVMPWIQKLQQFFVPDNIEGVTMFDTDEEALVYHMVCTTPTSDSEPSPIHGLCVVNDLLLGSSLVCLTDAMECVARPLDLLKRSLPMPDKSTEEEESADGTSLSPMRHLLSGSFVEHIRKILTRNTSTPLLRARTTRDLTQKDCLEILTEAQQVLREEYIQKQHHAKEEIEKRISILKDQKQKQQEDLEGLLEHQATVKDKAEELAEKIETVAVQDTLLMDRIEFICQQIQTHIPVLSSAEKGMKEELKTINLQVSFLKESLSQIKAKHEHKTRRSSSSKSSGLPLISPAQQKNIRSVLKNESESIGDIVNQLKDLKLQIGL